MLRPIGCLYMRLMMKASYCILQEQERIVIYFEWGKSLMEELTAFFVQNNEINAIIPQTAYQMHKYREYNEMSIC